jgi:hypothetical protein
MHMQSTSLARQYQAKVYPRIASELSGEYIDTDAWQKNQEQRQHLKTQSHFLASQLESEGIKAYIDQDLIIFGLHSKQYEVMPAFRNINFLPIVARKNRGSTLKLLEYYLDRNPNTRNSTLTSGTRCNSKQLKGRVQSMARKVSRCNDQIWMKALGAKFVFRTTEFGEVFADGDDLSYHPHMHLMMVLDRFIPKQDWSYLLSKIQNFFGTYWQDCGRVRNPREMVKYCVKPSDLSELSSKHLSKLFHATQGLRLVECLGDLRAKKRELKESRKKLVRRKGVLKSVPNWAGGASAHKVPAYMRGKCVGDEVSPYVVAWCAPSRIFTPVTEPIFIVHGLNGDDPSKVFAWHDVRQMEHSIKVHTKMITVPKEHERNTRQTKRKYENREKVPIEDTIPF